MWDVTDPLASSVGLIAPEAYLSFAGFLPDNKTLVAGSDEGGWGCGIGPRPRPNLLCYPKAAEAYRACRTWVV